MMKKLGTTNISIAPLGMGSGFTDSELKDPQNIIDALSFGIDQGMNVIDTGENYGGGVCEELIGRAIRGQRDQGQLPRSVWLMPKLNDGNIKSD